jgi:plasmid maintenance system antidote protein VapI
MSHDRTTLADTLRRAILASGLSVTALAREAGIAQPVLHRFMSRERDLTLRVADRLVAYLELELRPRIRR